MVNHVHAVFPDVPPDNIRFDLLRTGSVELTSNKILERGFLEAPPAAYYTVYPPAEAPVPQPSSGLRPASASSMSSSAKQPSLIERYSLHDRLEGVVSAPEIEVGGKAKWEDTAEKREASLQSHQRLSGISVSGHSVRVASTSSITWLLSPLSLSSL